MISAENLRRTTFEYRKKALQDMLVNAGNKGLCDLIVSANFIDEQMEDLLIGLGYILGYGIKDRVKISW
jgi:hypothetical protein